MNNSNPNHVAMEREQLALPVVFYEALSSTGIMFTSLEGATALDTRKYDSSKNLSSLCLLKTTSVFCVASNTWERFLYSKVIWWWCDRCQPWGTDKNNFEPWKKNYVTFAFLETDHSCVSEKISCSEMAPSTSPNICSPVAEKCLREHLLAEIQLDCSHLVWNCHFFLPDDPGIHSKLCETKSKRLSMPCQHHVKTLSLFFVLQCFIYCHVYGVCRKENTHVPQNECRDQRTNSGGQFPPFSFT